MSMRINRPAHSSAMPRQLQLFESPNVRGASGVRGESGVQLAGTGGVSAGGPVGPARSGCAPGSGGARQNVWLERPPDALLSALTPRHMDLADGAWVAYQDSWVNETDQLFELLVAETHWRQQVRTMYERQVRVPRLVGAPSAGTRSMRILTTFSRQLSVHAGRGLHSVSLAFYRDGRDSVAPHGDKMGPLVNDTVIAIVSLGGPRRLLLRRARQRLAAASPSGSVAATPAETVGSRGLDFMLGHGDVLLMGGTCQSTWLHGIPKCAKANPRISIMFREQIPQTVASTETPPVASVDPSAA